MPKMDKSRELMSRANELMPGGVNSPVRAFKAMGGDPPVLVRGEGPYVFDADGNRYLDWVASWGPLILGHAPKEVVEAVCDRVRYAASDQAWCVEPVR